MLRVATTLIPVKAVFNGETTVPGHIQVYCDMWVSALPFPGSHLSTNTNGKAEQLGKLVTDCPGRKSNPDPCIRKSTNHYVHHGRDHQ